MRVGVAQARKQLPELLRRANSGEDIIVTCRGADVASILPSSAARRNVLSMAKIRNAITSIAKTIQGIIGVVLFGSYARGEPGSKSDLDLILVLDEDHYWDAYAEFCQKISESLTISVDVVPTTINEWKNSSKDDNDVFAEAKTDGIAIYGKI